MLRSARVLSKRSCAFPRPARLSSAPRRGVHELRSLPYPLEHGLGQFLSPEALKVVAVEYQQGLLSRLNDEVKDTKFENSSVAQTVISTASSREHILAFNYASQALNNSFFLDNLKPVTDDGAEQPQNHEHEITQSLQNMINRDFLSLEQLKSTMSAAALGMTGSGWVWLAFDQSAQMLSVVPTYGAGTLLVQSRQHRYPEGMDNVAPKNSSGSLSAKGSTPAGVRTLSTFANESDFVSNNSGGVSRQETFTSFPSPAQTKSPKVLRKAGEDLAPILCISVHEHAWMAGGYGVWGKEEYLRRFWSVVDWGKVSKILERWSTSTGFNR